MDLKDCDCEWGRKPDAAMAVLVRVDVVVVGGKGLARLDDKGEKVGLVDVFGTTREVLGSTFMLRDACN